MWLDVRLHYLALKSRCLLGGVDISDTCFAANEEEGWADCFILDDHGQIVTTALGRLSKLHPATVRRYGKVELSLKET